MTRNPPLHEQRLPAQVYEAQYYEDEINLIDLWLVLMRRRRLLLGVTILCILVGGLLALWLPAKYEYRTSIEIGTRINGERVEVIESPQTLLAKIQESYIPLARQQYLAEHTSQKGVPKVEARIPKGSEIVVLNSKGPQSQEAAHKALQQSVVDKVKTDHGRIVDVLRKEIEVLQNQALAELEELKDEAKLIQAREQRLGDIAALLSSQAKELRSDLARAKADRDKAIQQTKDESRALTLMMLDSGMQQYRQRLAQIDERLKIKLVDSRDALAKQLADNQRAQLAQLDTVSKLKVRMTNLRETRALLPPIRSQESTGPGATLMLALSLVLGLMLGVFAVFFAEFLDKVRRQAAQQPAA